MTRMCVKFRHSLIHVSYASYTTFSITHFNTNNLISIFFFTFRTIANLKEIFNLTKF